MKKPYGIEKYIRLLLRNSFVILFLLAITFVFEINNLQHGIASENAADKPGQAPADQPVPQGQELPPVDLKQNPVNSPTSSPANTPNTAQPPAADPQVNEKTDTKPTTQAKSLADNFNPFTLTPEQVRLLEQLHQRYQKYLVHERKLEEKELALKAIESRIDKKQADLKKLQEQLQSLVNERDAEETAHLKRLVQMYEKMKPDKAASILEGLDIYSLLDMLKMMKESKAALIIAAMNTERAQILTQELFNRRQLAKEGKNKVESTMETSKGNE